MVNSMNDEPMMKAGRRIRRLCFRRAASKAPDEILITGWANSKRVHLAELFWRTYAPKSRQWRTPALTLSS